jgi:hypothetical protein
MALINLRNALMAGKRTPTAKDYVQDGLVAMFDLKENAGWGVYDESATRWMNLATGRLASDSGFVFTSGGAYVPALKSFSVTPFTLFNHTIEARISRFPDTQQNHGVTISQYMSLNGGSSSARGFNTQRYPIPTRQYIYEISGSCLAPDDIVPKDKHTLAATFEYDGTSTSIIKYYIDGEFVQSSTFDAVLTQANQKVYAQFRENNYLDRLNIYSHALPASEIAHNYAIDKERFGLT